MSVGSGRSGKSGKSGKSGVLVVRLCVVGLCVVLGCDSCGVGVAVECGGVKI